MAAPIRLAGGLRRSLPGYHERRAGEVPEITFRVTVGKSHTIREIPLTERQLIEQVKRGIEIIELLHRERDAAEGQSRR